MVDEVIGKYKTALIPPLVEWQAGRKKSQISADGGVGATHTQSNMQILDMR